MTNFHFHIYIISALGNSALLLPPFFYLDLLTWFLKVAEMVAISSRSNFGFEWACEAGNNGDSQNLHKHPSSFVYTGNIWVMLTYLNFLKMGKLMDTNTVQFRLCLPSQLQWSWSFSNSNRELHEILLKKSVLYYKELQQRTLTKWSLISGNRSGSHLLESSILYLEKGSLAGLPQILKCWGNYKVSRQLFSLYKSQG